MDEDDRTRLEADLEDAVSAAKRAIAAAVDALGSSRDTTRIARRAMRDAAATASASDTVAGSTGPDPVPAEADGA